MNLKKPWTSLRAHIIFVLAFLCGASLLGRASFTCHNIQNWMLEYSASCHQSIQKILRNYQGEDLRISVNIDELTHVYAALWKTDTKTKISLEIFSDTQRNLSEESLLLIEAHPHILPYLWSWPICLNSEQITRLRALWTPIDYGYASCK